MPFLPDILPCIVGGIFWRKVPRVPCPSRSPSVRPARSHSLPEERHLPRRPFAAPVASRCEPFSAFPLLPGPSTHPAGPSAASVSARCEPFSLNRRTPSSRDSGSWPGTMAAGAREQAASCDAFVLSRRPPAPDAPPSRTSPLCLIAKPSPTLAEPRPGPWPGLPLRIPSGSVKGAPSRRRSGRGRCDRRGLAGRVGHAHPALRVLQGLPS